ncbi:MAG TPA: MFS transporter [Streptosporangiaceae bacterium]|jgi:MFS family permease|nr:MFS transporter [Streptosporangiaceae bacterium]
MEDLKDPNMRKSRDSRAYIPAGIYVLRPGTLIAAVIAVVLAQMALAIPAVLNGLFQQDLGTSSSQLTWISDAFFVPVCMLELSFGVLGDLFGRKRLLVGGAIVLAIGEATAMLTPGAALPIGERMLVLWTGEALAGLGAAAIFPTSLAMIAAGTHTSKARARSISIWAAGLSVGNCASPILGGLAARLRFGPDPLAGWRWAFLVVLTLALISAAVSATAAKDSSSPEGRSLDWPGQATIAVSLFAMLFAVVQGPSSGWGSPEILAGFAVAAVFLLLFILVERRSQAPLLRLDFFRNRNFAAASIVTIFGMFAFLGIAYSISIRLSAIQGFSPLKTAVAFLISNGIALVQLPVTIRLMERTSPKWPLSGGLVLMAAGAIWMAVTPTTTMSLIPVIPPFVLVGIGFALALTALTAIAVNTPPTHLAGMASGTTNMLRDFGFTLGPAVIGAVALSQAAGEIRSRLAASATLRKALATFNAAPAHTPLAQRAEVEGAVHAVASGPLGANAVPATITLPSGQSVPFNPLKGVAFDALSRSYSHGFLLSGAAALLAALVTVIAMRARSDEPLLDLEALDE